MDLNHLVSINLITRKLQCIEQNDDYYIEQIINKYKHVDKYLSNAHAAGLGENKWPEFIGIQIESRNYPLCMLIIVVIDMGKCRKQMLCVGWPWHNNMPEWGGGESNMYNWNPKCN